MWLIVLSSACNVHFIFFISFIFFMFECALVSIIFNFNSFSDVVFPLKTDYLTMFSK